MARENFSQMKTEQVDVSVTAVRHRDETRWKSSCRPTKVVEMRAGGSASGRRAIRAKRKTGIYSRATATGQVTASFSRTSPRPAILKRNYSLPSPATTVGRMHLTLLVSQVTQSGVPATSNCSLIQTKAPVSVVQPAQLVQPAKIKGLPSVAVLHKGYQSRAEVPRCASCSLPSTTKTAMRPATTPARNCFLTRWRDAVDLGAGPRICSVEGMKQDQWIKVHCRYCYSASWVSMGSRRFANGMGKLNLSIKLP
jgi:hypothetical protein